MTERIVLVLGLLAAATAFGLWWRTRDGRLREVDAGREGALTAEQVGVVLGREATLVQFSSPTCATCPQTAVVLGEVAARLDGVVHVELDVDRHDLLVRRLRVMRTPSVLVLDGGGHVVARTSGAVRPEQAESLVEAARHSCPEPVGC